MIEPPSPSSPSPSPPTDVDTPEPVSTARDVRYRFGDFELGTRPLRLARFASDGDDPEEVTIQPQPARALELLAEKAGELVSREELREHLWGLDAHLDHEQAINFTIRKVRTALGDSAQSPTYVETLPRQGYRMVAPVQRQVIEPELSSSTPPPDPPSTRRRFPLAWAVALLVLVAISALFFGSSLLDSAAPDSAAPDPAAPDPVPLDGAQQDALWRARVLIERGDEASTLEARELLEALVLEVPDSPEVAETLARAWLAWGSLPAPTGKSFALYMPEMERWGERARRLDPGALDGHVAVANVRFYHHKDWQGARQVLEQEVLPRDPEHPSGLHLYGLYLGAVGRFDEAVDTIRRAVAADPEGIYVISDLAITLVLARRYEEAIEQARQNLELDPENQAQYWLILEAADLWGRDDIVAETVGRVLRGPAPAEPPDLEAVYQVAYSTLLPRVEAGAPLHTYLARFSVRLGETEQAFDHLLAACEGPGDWDLPQAGVHPRFDALRSHPRWQELEGCVPTLEAPLPMASRPTAVGAEVGDDIGEGAGR